MNDENWVLNQVEWDYDSRRFLDRMSEISDFNIRRDLFKFFTSLDLLHIEIIREENRCKINRRRSDRHIALMAEYAEARQNFIEHMTLGLLCQTSR